MSESLYIEVEENDNCEYMPLQVYEARAASVPVRRVRLFEPDRPQGVCEVIGWCSDSALGAVCPAMYVPVSDSGQAVVHLIFGGDWGVRFRQYGGEAWDIENPNQWGVPYLMLTDGADVLLGV